MYQVSLKILCFESWYRFLGADEEKIGKVLSEMGFWRNFFYGKDIDYNVISQKIIYIVMSRL